MPKKKQTTKKHPGGRPTRYSKSLCIQAAKLCKLGATDKDLADFFGVVEATINNWKNKYPEFLESLKDAKSELDEQVEKSLFKKAMGYRYKEEASTKIGVVDLEKQAHPDSTAIIFWLKNRQPAKWRDKQEIQLDGELTTKAVFQIVDSQGNPVESSKEE